MTEIVQKTLDNSNSGFRVKQTNLDFWNDWSGSKSSSKSSNKFF